MDFDEFDEENEESKEEENVDRFRKQIADRIALESDKLISTLFEIVYDPEIEAKVKLTAISMLLDRGIPKLGVDHTKIEAVEESDNYKAMREEIEKLIEDQDD